MQSPLTGKRYRLEGPSRRIWERLDYPTTEEALTATLVAEYDAGADTIGPAVRSVLSDLICARLVAEDGSPPHPLRDRYLGLLKRAVANMLYPELELQIQYLQEQEEVGRGIELQRFLRDIEERQPEKLVRLMAAKREGGQPLRFAHSMIGHIRLTNIERCAEQVISDGIAGDFLEAGVCRGGAAILMRALQIAHDASERCTWLIDSFQGVPSSVKETDRVYDLELGEPSAPWLSASETKVRELFSRYDILDENVRFIPGWLSESLPSAPIGALAILRIDVDIYSSTSECLDLLYDRVSPGGFIIVDDYGYYLPCKDAVDDFRRRHRIAEPIDWVDRWGIFWRKTKAA